MAVNNCGTRVFIIWCGNLKSSYSASRCGDGPDGGFYTQSVNLDGGKETRLHVESDLHWGACEGGIGFGGRGTHFNDYPGGTYECIPR